MKLNKEAENVYIKLGINMPYSVMTMYYKGIDLYKRMLCDIIMNKYKPLNRIFQNEKPNNDFKEYINNDGNVYKIISKNTNKIYIGSTSMKIEYRLRKHIMIMNFIKSIRLITYHHMK
jgi:hypothetical protein